MQNKGNALLFLMAMCTVLLVSTVPLHGATVERLVDPAATPPDDNLDGTIIDLQAPPMQAKPAQGPPYRNTRPDVSSAFQEIQYPAPQVGVLFPATGDDVSVASDPNWWHVGDYAEGTRTLGLSSVNAVSYDLAMSNNVLNGTGHVDFHLSINGMVVGSFSVLPGEMSKSVVFFFPTITGPTYTIRLEETNAVDPGAGSIIIPLDASPIRLFDSTSPFFPATGDDISVAADPNWWHAGDYAEGTRTPGLSGVHGVSYDLAILNNVLSGTAHLDFDLSINGAVVGSFAVLPGETSKSLTFSFPPISGPSYTIRLEETNEVEPGMGSIIIPLDTSPIMLDPWYSVYLPLAVR